MSIIYSENSGLNNAAVGKLETPLKMVIEHESDLQTKRGGICDWLFNIERSTKFGETVVGQNEFGIFAATEEGAGAENDEIRETYRKFIEHIQFMKEFTITAQMMEDANYGVAADAKRRAENFTRAYYKTMHCDFGLCGANNEQSRKIYARFDKIVACSEGCRRAFINCMPELAEKTASVRNCNDFEQIRELAKNAVTYEDGFLNIVTVARLSEEKGIERALAALAVCVAKGYRLRYHIVGSGDQESKLRNIVLEKSLTETVFFYGNQKNPYPYIANADLFLLPSYHEAAPVVFDEAACLGVPVLATQTTSTEEMIMQSGNGFVCENSDVGIQHGLEEILADPQKLNEVRQHIKEKEFGNQSIVGKFDALFA